MIDSNADSLSMTIIQSSVADRLCQLLADNQTLTLKTHNYHWNVTGPLFGQLHALFDEQYNDTNDAADVIAERLRALGYPAPGSFADYGARTKIMEAGTARIPALKMVADLERDNRTLTEDAIAVVVAGTAAGDQASVNIAVERQYAHQKSAWKLRMYLEL